MCLVPERVFSRAPVEIILVYLCRFVVRAPCGLLRGFSRQRDIVQRIMDLIGQFLPLPKYTVWNDHVACKVSTSTGRSTLIVKHWGNAVLGR